MRKKYRIAWGSIAPVLFILFLIIVLAVLTEGRLI